MQKKLMININTLRQTIRRLFAFCVCFFILLVGICLFSFLLVINLSHPYIFNKLQDLETIHPAKIMVLGAKVYADGTVSPLLRQRLDQAKQAYLYLLEKQETKQKLKCGTCESNSISASSKPICLKIVLSGGQAGHYDEPAAMANYLEAQGVSASALLLDKDGVNTLRSCQNYLAKYEHEQVLIVTSDYHLPRACFLARQIGLQAYGLSADSSNLNLTTKIFNFCREALSRVKAIINIYLSPNFAN